MTFWKCVFLTEKGEHRSKDADHIYGVHNSWSEWSRTDIFHSRTLLLSKWYWPLYLVNTWQPCKTDISEEVRYRRSHVISRLSAVPRQPTLIPDHSFHYIYATCNNNKKYTPCHKVRCPGLISDSEVLQFVTSENLSLTENAGKHRSKDTAHIYVVHNSWAEWSRAEIFHRRL